MKSGMKRIIAWLMTFAMMFSMMGDLSVFAEETVQNNTAVVEDIPVPAALQEKAAPAEQPSAPAQQEKPAQKEEAPVKDEQEKPAEKGEASESAAPAGYLRDTRQWRVIVNDSGAFSITLLSCKLIILHSLFIILVYTKAIYIVQSKIVLCIRKSLISCKLIILYSFFIILFYT